jgi:hypothetical protein
MAGTDEPRIPLRQGYGVTGSADVTDWNNRKDEGIAEATSWI